MKKIVHLVKIAWYLFYADEYFFASGFRTAAAFTICLHSNLHTSMFLDACNDWAGESDE